MPILGSLWCRVSPLPNCVLQLSLEGWVHLMGPLERWCSEVCVLPGAVAERWGTFLQNSQSWFVIHLSLLSSFCTGGLRALWWELRRCSTVCRLRTRESSLSLHLSSDHSLSLIVIRLVDTVCPHANCTLISGIICRINRSTCIMSSKQINKCETQQWNVHEGVSAWPRPFKA